MMNDKKLEKLIVYCLKFLGVVTLIIFWYFDFFQDAYEDYQSKAITIVTRKQKTKDLEIPTVTICPNFAFKPSINQQFDFPTRDLFIYSQETNQNLQSIFHGQTVLDVFKNFSYANDFSFRFMNNLNKLEFKLNPGENMVQRGHVSVNSVL